MNNIDISNFIIQAKALVKNFDVGLCITILNASGNKEFFISLGEIRPCSIDMSEKKAKTAYNFMGDNHQIYDLLKGLGDMPLISSEYCFIAGGNYLSDQFGNKKFLGVSSSDPSKDLEIAKILANDLMSGGGK